MQKTRPAAQQPAAQQGCQPNSRQSRQSTAPGTPDTLLIDHLCYALCGFDTECIRLEAPPDDSPHLAASPSLSVSGLSQPLVEPFVPLILAVRQQQHAAALPVIADYLQTVSRLRTTVSTPEELYVSVSGYVPVFECLSRARALTADGAAIGLDVISHSVRSGIINTPAVDDVITRLNDQQNRRVLDGIEQWVNSGEMTGSRAIMEEQQQVDPFGGCLWRDKYRIKRLRGLGRREREDIETAGKIVNLMRNLFQREIIGDRGEHSAAGTLDALQLPLGSSFAALLHSRRECLQHLMNGALLGAVRFELAVFYDVLLLQDYSLHTEMLEEFGEPLLTGAASLLPRINAFIRDRYARSHPSCRQEGAAHRRRVEQVGRWKGASGVLSPSGQSSQGDDCSHEPFGCVLSGVSLGEYVLRLLNTQKPAQPNEHLTMLERVSYAYGPGYLQIFLGDKTFVEARIVSRFLFLTGTVCWYLERKPSHRFTRMIHLILSQIRNDRIGDVGGESDDVVEVAEGFQRQMSDLLERYFLTNGEIFGHWNGIFNLAIEYVHIPYGTAVDAVSYGNRLYGIVAALRAAIVKHTGENDFTELLGRMSPEMF